MPLVDMRDMLDHAYRNGYAVGSFDLASLDFLEAVVAAAEDCRSPVIVSVAESDGQPYDFELAMAAAERAARGAAVPIAIHLDRGADQESAIRAINLGCNGVTVDAAHESFPVNVARTRRAVDMAHACGVAVEGELGHGAGGEGEHPGENQCTSVDEARAYVTRTGVDCLAISVGPVNGRSRGKPRPDFERLRRLRDAVKVPLVFRDGAGLSDEHCRRLISHGVAKINYHAALAEIAGERVRANARADGRCGYSGLFRGVQDSVRDEVGRVMRLWGSAGRAAEVLVQCRAWWPVEHVILYNVDGAEDDDVDAIMARGREQLARIPGVRRVVTGWAVTDKPKYRFCWLVEFVHEQVIASYRDHPEHVAFADRFFRPIAGDRVSIDFLHVNGAVPIPVTGEAHRRQA
jgi:fructose-bisphosphate aldolase class II